MNVGPLAVQHYPASFITTGVLMAGLTARDGARGIGEWLLCVNVVDMAGPSVYFPVMFVFAMFGYIIGRPQVRSLPVMATTLIFIASEGPIAFILDYHLIDAVLFSIIYFNTWPVPIRDEKAKEPVQPVHGD